ncbi:hypothetical protein OHA21_38285 [Actinoplanes sp. NBC_00393]|uniref:hypothetical protein n=1 Tax=Actinoplanes sp. NBC_00393 TaxID=2975953 RepID=UPI002E246A8E
MTMIVSRVAVLVPASATINTIGAHLTAPLHFLPADSYRLSGDSTGAGNTPYPGDLIPLPRLLDPQFRFPAGDQLVPIRETTAPDLYADAFYGLRALDKTRSGEVSTGLRTVLQAALTARRDRSTDSHPLDPADWQIAMVAAHITDRQERAALPGLGSLVQIIDPQHQHGQDPEQLYVVRDDFQAPDHYDLVSLGDIGPNVPGYALVEIDPARVRLLPTPPGALPYPPALDDADT